MNAQALQERWEVSGEKLFQLESDQKELKRANALIARLRAEIDVLKDEKAEQAKTISEAYHHISVSGNLQKKWAIKFVARKLGISFK